MAAAHVLAADERLPPALSFSLTRTETLASFESPTSDGGASDDAFDAHALSAAQLHETFLGAELFASAVLSRLHREPLALDARLWALQEHENRLWALKQQALLGSCDTSRGSKAYLAALDPTAAAAAGGAAGAGRLSWRPCCCFRMMGESKIKLWQNLGDLPHEQAKIGYIRIVSDICPEWRNPLRADSALLRTWTPDDESDQCALCAETFTFLNRRHHCRRCLSLVCAVCSPCAVPLRMFSQTAAPKRQRVCSACFREMQEQIEVASPSPHARASESDDDALLLGRSAAHKRSSALESIASNDDDAAATSLSTSAADGANASPVLSSAAIHCGTLDFFHGGGFRKSWHTYFFVLLIRKGSLGMFLSAQDHAEKKARPAAVFKLSGYALRVKSQKRRPHQFRAAHATKKALHFAARSIEEMNGWITQLLKAIEVANELEALAPVRAPRRGSLALSTSSLGSGGSSPRAASDLADEDADAAERSGTGAEVESASSSRVGI